MSEKKESASIRFQSPASLPVYHHFQALLLRRKAENPERKVYAWQVLGEALDALEKIESIQSSLKIMDDHNRWRRGDEGIEQHNPAIIGIAIDQVINSLKK